MTFRESTLSTTSGSFSAIDFGGTGPHCLLIHGTGQNALAWMRFAEALAVRYHVVAFDMRGHGQTPENSDNPEQYWRDIGPITTALGIDRPILIGHSTGAYAATAYVAAGNDASALVCVDGFTLDAHSAGATEPTSKSWDAARDALVERFRYGWRATEAERDAYIDQLVATADDDPFNVGIEPALLRAMVTRCFVKRDERFLRRPTLEEIFTVSTPVANAAIAPTRAVYDLIDIPLLLVWAEHGLMADRYGELEQVVAAGQNRKLISMTASHNIPMQHPDTLAAEVVAGLT